MIVKNFLGGSGGESANIYLTGLLSTDDVSATSPSGKSLSATWGSKPNPESHNLPSGYTEVEYIEGSGANSYINTNWYTTTTSGVTFEIGYSLNSYNTRFCGAWGNVSHNNATFVIWCDSTDTCVIEHGNVQEKTAFSLALNTKTDISIDVTSSGTYTFTKDGVSVTGTMGGATAGTLPVYLFKMDGTSYYGSGKIYYARLKRDGVVERDFIPCLNTTTNEYGMYDLVTETFFGSETSTGFTGGDDIPTTIPCWKITASEYGTYSITAERGSLETSESVLVDCATDYTVEMSFANTTYLYYLGDECEDITGGWEEGDSGWHEYGDSNVYSKAGSTTWNTSDVYLNIGSGTRGSRGIETINSIDITDYTMFVARITQFYNYYTGDNQLGVATSPIDTEPVLLSSNSFSYLSSGYWNAFTPSSSMTVPFFNITDFSSYKTYYTGSHKIGQIFRTTGWTGMQGKFNCVAMAKADDISGLSAYGSTISAILANSASLLANESAVQTMLSCTGDFMWNALANSTWISAYNSSAYKSAIDANTDWAKALALL